MDRFAAWILLLVLLPVCAGCWIERDTSEAEAQERIADAIELLVEKTEPAVWPMLCRIACLSPTDTLWLYGVQESADTMKWYTEEELRIKYPPPPEKRIADALERLANAADEGKLSPRFILEAIGTHPLPDSLLIGWEDSLGGK